MKYQSTMNKLRKTAANNLIAGDIYHPGEFLKEEMDARGMKQVDLVEALGVSKSEVSLIIHGKRNITASMAVMLESVFGITAEVWMNLQVKYEIELVKMTHNAELSSKTLTQRKKDILKKAIAYA
jgi:addiction module HigA family antidote